MLSLRLSALRLRRSPLSPSTSARTSLPPPPSRRSSKAAGSPSSLEWLQPQNRKTKGDINKSDAPGGAVVARESPSRRPSEGASIRRLCRGREGAARRRTSLLGRERKTSGGGGGGCEKLTTEGGGKRRCGAVVT
eukprot:288741-Prorocentrum_minimum.AAC.2